jgi:hypothetical protein
MAIRKGEIIIVITKKEVEEFSGMGGRPLGV